MASFCVSGETGDIATGVFKGDGRPDIVVDFQGAKAIGVLTERIRGAAIRVPSPLRRNGLRARALNSPIVQCGSRTHDVYPHTLIPTSRRTFSPLVTISPDAANSWGLESIVRLRSCDRRSPKTFVALRARSDAIALEPKLVHPQSSKVNEWDRLRLAT